VVVFGSVACRLSGHGMTLNDGRRVQNLVYPQALERIEEAFEPTARRLITAGVIERAVDEAAKGMSNADLAVIIKYPGMFCDRCGECCRRSNPISVDADDLVCRSFALTYPRAMGYLTIGFYPYCRFAVNYAAWKTVAVLCRLLVEQERPGLAYQVKLEQEKLTKRFSSLPQVQEIRFWRRYLSKLERENGRE